MLNAYEHVSVHPTSPHTGGGPCLCLSWVGSVVPYLSGPPHTSRHPAHQLCCTYVLVAGKMDVALPHPGAISHRFSSVECCVGRLVGSVALPLVAVSCFFLEVLHPSLVRSCISGFCGRPQLIVPVVCALQLVLCGMSALAQLSPFLLR